jgi:hypothetical protein
MSIRSRIEKLENAGGGVQPYICPQCQKRNWAIDRPTEDSPPRCVYCAAEMPEPPEGVIIKCYIGVSLSDL